MTTSHECSVLSGRIDPGEVFDRDQWQPAVDVSADELCLSAEGDYFVRGIMAEVLKRDRRMLTSANDHKPRSASPSPHIELIMVVDHTSGAERYLEPV